MIELYQELVPFTNEKTTNKVSSDGGYANPVFMPLSFDITSSYNTVETVLYIRNSNKDKYYKNVLICLLAPIAYAANPLIADGFTTPTVISTSLSGSPKKVIFKNGGTTVFELDTDYGAELPPVINPDLQVNTFDSSLGITTMPISNITNYTMDQNNYEVMDVKFSLGYDEVSEKNWNSKSHSVIIPDIGTTTTPDNSYKPIRMRITLNNKYGDMITLRKFSLLIGYGQEGNIV